MPSLSWNPNCIPMIFKRIPVVSKDCGFIATLYYGSNRERWVMETYMMAHQVKWELVCYHRWWTEWVSRWNRWLRRFIRGLQWRNRMRSSFCCVGSDGSCHDDVDWRSRLGEKKRMIVCDKVPVGVFVYTKQERKRYHSPCSNLA